MLKTGDKVMCAYRLPTPHQHWIHPCWVGTIMEQGTDPAKWNGHNSEEHYCRMTGKVPIVWDDENGKTFRSHDTLDSLFASPHPATYTPTSEEDMQRIQDMAERECPVYFGRLAETMAGVFREIFAPAS